MRLLYPATVLLLSASLSCQAFLAVENTGREHSSMTPLRAKKDATFGMGCFWKPSEELLKVRGVVDTAAGYTGNPSATDIPKYDSVCFSRQWVEGVRVEYDDEEITYPELLEAFFEAQEPKIGGSRQYASIIFPHDEEQRKEAEQWIEQGTSMRRVRESDGVPVAITVVEPLSPFYKAEGYHQRYWQKFRPRVAAVAFFVALLWAPLEDYNVVAADVQSTIHTVADWALKAIAASVILERVLDTKVEKL